MAKISSKHFAPKQSRLAKLPMFANFLFLPIGFLNCMNNCTEMQITILHKNNYMSKVTSYYSP